MTRYKSTNTLRMISGQHSVLSARITPAEVGEGRGGNNKTNQSKLFLFEYPWRHIYYASVLIIHEKWQIVTRTFIIEYVQG
jgi:hypothetical protein